MKIRKGFVTNSSSSSYVIAKKKNATLADIKNALLNVKDQAVDFLKENGKWIDLEPEVDKALKEEDYSKAADEFLNELADYLHRNFNQGTLDDWDVGSDEFWDDSGNAYERFILEYAWLIGDNNLQVI